jgi:hypothetical protein
MLEHLDGHDQVEAAVPEGQLLRVGVQEARAAVGPPLAAQTSVGQVERGHLAEAVVQLAGDHALAAAHLERPLRRPAGVLTEPVEDPLEVGDPSLREPADRRVLGGVLRGGVADDDSGRLRREGIGALAHDGQSPALVGDVGLRKPVAGCRRS